MRAAKGEGGEEQTQARAARRARASEKEKECFVWRRRRVLWSRCQALHSLHSHRLWGFACNCDVGKSSIPS